MIEKKLQLLTRGLIIDEPWIGLILSGKKTWEMRSTGTKIRGLFGLIRKGSGQVVGTANLVDSRPPLSRENYSRTEQYHAISSDRRPKAILGGWIHPWVLAEARRLPTPISYRHKSGATIWVTLDAAVIAAVQESCPPPSQSQ